MTGPEIPRHQPGDQIFVTAYRTSRKRVRAPAGWKLQGPWWVRLLHRPGWNPRPVTYRIAEQDSQP